MVQASEGLAGVVRACSVAEGWRATFLEGVRW